MHPGVLNELRLLSNMQFDSRHLLSVVFAGDGRFIRKLRRDELLPLGSRIRTRLNMEYASRDELADCLNHLLNTAGNAHLMTQQLMATLCDHAAGNYRILTGMAGELLATAAQRELTQLDEQLFLELYSPTHRRPGNRMSNLWTMPEVQPSLILGDAPDLSNQTASEVLEFLYQLVNAFEGRYGPQLCNYYQGNDYQDCQSRESQPDLFDDIEDDLPIF